MQHLKYALLPAFALSAISVSAQDLAEAYNLSNLKVQGTARSMGFGNALGSVGGDFSSLSVNPAGLGVYRSSELSFTSSLRANSATSQYLGTETMDNNVHFNINNFGMVFTNAPKGKRYEKRDWKTVSFAFGMNRVADFNRTYTYAGRNNNSSATQVFESDANQYPNYTVGTQNANGLGYMGYQAYLIDQVEPNRYKSIVPIAGGINQTKNIKENGGINEYVIALGGNYKEKLILGATIGLPSFNYTRKTYYTETLAPGNNGNGDTSVFTRMNYGETLDLTGNGINLKIGAIYKLNDYFRIGGAFHSPTFYTITDIYRPEITSVVNNNVYNLSVGNGSLIENQFDYFLTTPWKSVLSATFIYKKLGFITADLEYVDHASARYTYPDGIDNSTGQSFSEEANAKNQEISRTYTGVTNLRIGAEGVINKFFMLRAGFGYYGNPYQNTAYDGTRMDFSGGLGFRFQHFFADFGVVHTQYKSTETPYTIDYSNSSVISGPAVASPVAYNTFKGNNIALSIGLKF